MVSQIEMGNIADRFVFPLAQQSCETTYVNEDIFSQVEWVETDEYKIPLIIIRRELPRAVILYSHGNGETVYNISEYLEMLSKELHVDVWYWDYAGYGPHKLNDNVSPSEENVYSDICTLTKMITEDGRYTFTPKILWGRSLGCAPSIYAAVQYEDELDGLIVESGFRSCVRVIQPSWVASSVHSVYDIFDNESNIAKLHTIPVLFIHGTKDRVVPFEHGTYLLNECKAPKDHLWLKDGGHNNLNTEYRTELLEKVELFFDTI